MKLLCRLTASSALTLLFLASNVAAQPENPGPPPEQISLLTKDGVQLSLTYYGSLLQKGTPAAMQVTPVVLLHDYKDSRANFASLARRLQFSFDETTKRPAFAVVAVDLRGHGDSTKQLFPNGSQQELDAAKINPGGLAAMVSLDMEEVRRWLVGKNDEGSLNLNKLCLVGAGMGASVATQWAAQDWSAPPLAVGKQGQDVKALVLISPRWTYRGLMMQAPLQQLALKQNAAWMLIYGAEDADTKSDARRIYDQLSKFHPTGDAAKDSSLSALGWPTSLQGGKVLSSQIGPSIEDQIVKFLSTQVADRDFPWLNRRGRLP